MSPRLFEGPSALDLFADFKRRYLAFADRRVEEIEDQILKLRAEAPIEKESHAYSEIRALYRQIDEIRYFEPTLNRLIQTFVQEAIKPWQQAFTDALMRNPPMIIPGSDRSPL